MRERRPFLIYIITFILMWMGEFASGVLFFVLFCEVECPELVMNGDHLTVQLLPISLSDEWGSLDCPIAAEIVMRGVAFHISTQVAEIVTAFILLFLWRHC